METKRNWCMETKRNWPLILGSLITSVFFFVLGMSLNSVHLSMFDKLSVVGLLVFQSVYGWWNSSTFKFFVWIYIPGYWAQFLLGWALARIFGIA